MATMNVYKVGQNGQMEVKSEWFVARITEVDSSDTGTGLCAARKHGWIEQKICSNGTAYEDAPAESAETGDIAVGNWAFPIGGGNASVNDLVLMRYKSMDTNSIAIYEFIPIPTSSGSGYVTSVQCTGGMTVVTYDS